MWQLIFISVVMSIFALGGVFVCGAYWHSMEEEGGEVSEGDAIWLFLVTALCVIMSVLLWLETGRVIVKTRELPKIEHKVTLREHDGEIESDTLYIFKFR